jgi:hypothetical protein
MISILGNKYTCFTSTRKSATDSWATKTAAAIGVYFTITAFITSATTIALHGRRSTSSKASGASGTSESNHTGFVAHQQC